MPAPAHSLRNDYPAVIQGNQGMRCGGSLAPLQEWSGYAHRIACEKVDGYGDPLWRPDCSIVIAVTDSGLSSLESMLEESDRVWLVPGLYTTSSTNFMGWEFQVPLSTGVPSYWDIDYWSGSLQALLWQMIPPDTFVPIRIRGFTLSDSYNQIALTGVNIDGAGWVEGEPWPCPGDVNRWREETSTPEGGAATQDQVSQFAGEGNLVENADKVIWFYPFGEHAGAAWQVLGGKELALAALASSSIAGGAAKSADVYLEATRTWPAWAIDQGSPYSTLDVALVDVHEESTPPGPPEEEPPIGGGTPPDDIVPGECYPPSQPVEGGPFSCPDGTAWDSDRFCCVGLEPTTGQPPEGEGDGEGGGEPGGGPIEDPGGLDPGGDPGERFPEPPGEEPVAAPGAIKVAAAIGALLLLPVLLDEDRDR